MHVMLIPSWYSSERKKVHGSFFLEQFKELQKSGVKVTVAYNEIWPITYLGKIKDKRGISVNSESDLETYRYKDFNYLPKNPLMFKSFNRRMDKLYKKIVKERGKVDIIHAHSCFWGGIAGYYLSQKYDIPLVVTEHTSLENSKYVRESYKKYIFEVYNNCTRLIAVGNGLKKELESYTNNEIRVIHNLVDLSLFDIRKDESYDEFTFFTCAYLESGKGIETLIEAFAKSFKGNKNIQLIIGGDGSLKKQLEELSTQFGIDKQTIFLGALTRKEVAIEMNRCNCFVLPSEFETFGVVYIEAIASGKPIIGTKNGGAEDIITDTNGIIIDKKNIYKLAKALVYMKNNELKYDPKKIREEAISKYSGNVIINKLKGVYKELL
jgi:glycosyltransferase involved in cell wall biosynthesis